MSLIVAACVTISVASLALPVAAAVDPWSWLVWGRELVAFDLSTGSGSSVMVSWKPLPVLITALLSPFGDLAPELWLVVARAGSLLALALAYRLGARLAGSAAGLVAVLGLLLMPSWKGWSGTGAVEPLLAALALWAVERHLDGHRGQAFFLGFLVALGRPEAAPLLVLYGVLAWRFEPRKLLGVLAAGAALVLLWFGVDWLASGSPTTGSVRAGGSEGSALAKLGRPLSLVLPPVWLLALVGGALAARNAGTMRRSLQDRRLPAPEARVTVVLAAGVLAWIATVVAMSAAGYPALTRFMVPAGAALCVVAGVGASWLLRTITTSRFAVPALVGAVLLALPFAIPRLVVLPQRAVEFSELATTFEEVQEAVQAAGGPERLLDCGPIGSANPYMQGPLAWELGVHLDEVQVILEKANLGHLDVAVVVAVDRSSARSAMSESRPRARFEVLGGSGDWSVFAVHERALPSGPATARRGPKSGPECPASTRVERT